MSISAFFQWRNHRRSFWNIRCIPPIRLRSSLWGESPPELIDLTLQIPKIDLWILIKLLRLWLATANLRISMRFCKNRHAVTIHDFKTEKAFFLLKKWNPLTHFNSVYQLISCGPMKNAFIQCTINNFFYSKLINFTYIWLQVRDTNSYY